MILREIKHEENKRKTARKHVEGRKHEKRWHAVHGEEAEFEYQNSRPHIAGKYEHIPKGPLSVHARNTTNERKKKEWHEERQRSALRKEMDVCTFKPTIHGLPEEHRGATERRKTMASLALQATFEQHDHNRSGGHEHDQGQEPTETTPVRSVG